MKRIAQLPLQFIAALAAIDFIFFTATDPNKINAVFLIVGFLLLVITLYLVAIKIIVFGRFYGIKIAKPERLALFFTAVLGGLLALQSMGELGLRDALVVLPLAAVLYMYLSYGRSRPETS